MMITITTFVYRKIITIVVNKYLSEDQLACIIRMYQVHNVRHAQQQLKSGQLLNRLLLADN